MLTAGIFAAFVILWMIGLCLLDDQFWASFAFMSLGFALFVVWTWRIGQPTPDEARANNARATIAAATAAAPLATAESELLALERAAATAAAAAKGGE